MDNAQILRIARMISTLGGVGRVAVAPGTAGSLVALPFAFFLAATFGRFVLVLCAILALGIGTWACEIYARNKGESDPKECVVDELAGQWIVCAFAPIHTPLYWSIPAYLLAFVLFRFFDILKPWPIKTVERRVPGGLGIMADDVVAALMGCVIMAILGHLGLI